MKGKPINLDDIISDFKALAAKTTPDSRVRDAEAADIWSCYKSRATGLTFNAVKKLAGLPVQRDRKRGAKSKYVSSLPPKGPEVKKTKPCLGILQNESHCDKKVRKGEYFCPACKLRNQRS
ncbi:MAG: hypothetical protein AAB922_02690 [Patescibacteria group bacterium]